MADLTPNRTLRQQVMDMESPIEDIGNSVSILNKLLDAHFNRKHTGVTGRPDFYFLNDSDISDMFFAASLIIQYFNQAKAQWELASEALQ